MDDGVPVWEILERGANLANVWWAVDQEETNERYGGELDLWESIE